MASSGPNNPSFAINDTAFPGNFAWLNATNVLLEDGAGSVFDVPADQGMRVSDALRITGFGFSIPIGSTINGILVRIKKRELANPDGQYYDFLVVLYYAGMLPGVNKAKSGEWAQTYTWYDYGNSADTWSAVPTPEMVNSPDFGLVLMAQGEAVAGGTGCRVDNAQMTIYYTPPIPPFAHINGIKVNGKSTGLGIDPVSQGGSVQIESVFQNTGGSAGNIKYELYDADSPATPIDTQTLNNVSADSTPHYFYTNLVMPNHDFRFFIKASHWED